VYPDEGRFYRIQLEYDLRTSTTFPEMTEILEPAPQLVDSCFAANLSNQGLLLGSVGPEQFRLLLTLHALFFDRIILSVTDFLANDVLFALAKPDPPGARTFYRAVLAPISDTDSCQVIAESMIENKTIHNLADDSELRAHAALMDQAGLEFRYQHEGTTREQYHQLLTKLTTEPGAALNRLTPADLKGLANWLRRQEPCRTFCSDLYRWADRRIANEASRHQLKNVAGVTHQLVRSDGAYAVFGSPDGIWADAVRAVHLKVHPETWSFQKLQPMNPDEQPSVGIDIGQLNGLALDEIAELRNCAPIPALRGDLAAHRAGRKRLDPVALELRLEEAGSIITDYAAATKLGRKGRMRRYANNAKFRLLHDASTAAGPEALTFLVPGAKGFLLNILTGFVLNRIAPKSSGIRASNTCISGPRYAPLTGTLLPRTKRQDPPRAR
jgi:hypothetical protein